MSQCYCRKMLYENAQEALLAVEAKQPNEALEKVPSKRGHVMPICREAAVILFNIITIMSVDMQLFVCLTLF